MEKPAETKYPIHDLLKRRWSPRAFSDRQVETAKLRQLFEAARWSASSFNEQPWSFIVALHCLVEANQTWAKLAPILIFTIAQRAFTRNNKPNRMCEHDLGLAVGNFTTQATALGLVLHQMGGIDPDKVRQTYHIPQSHDPVTAIAVGYPGEAGLLGDEAMRQAEQAPRDRKPCNDFVFTEKFGQASQIFH
jgi:nitroreductase